MIKIGITGQSGFIGQHLYNTLSIYPDKYERIEFCREFFKDSIKLNDFVSKCDVIVHLAAMNRHNDENILYENNIELTKTLVNSLQVTNSKAHVLFSSSSQEESNNFYGKSKLEGRQYLADWAKKCDGKFTGLIIPNVFGSFGHPYHNSFISTFCHQLTNNETPQIKVDSSVKLIYIDNLIEKLLDKIESSLNVNLFVIPNTDEYKVSEILILLENFKKQYLDLGIIPELSNLFEVNLFNTFRGYVNFEQHFPVKYNKHHDDRGMFIELIKSNKGGQISFSTTVGGVTRGNHFHTRKIERFAVIKGEALIKLRKIGADKIIEFYISGNEPAYIDIPIWHSHNIKNIGSEDLYTIFWISEFFNPADPDTYFETV